MQFSPNKVEHYVKHNLSEVFKKNRKIKERVAQAATMKNYKISLNNWAKEQASNISCCPYDIMIYSKSIMQIFFTDLFA